MTDRADLPARLRDGIAVRPMETADGLMPDLGATASLMSEAAARIEALEAALKPFAALYDESMRDFPDGTAKTERPDDRHAWGFNDANITWGDFRRARAALSQTSKPEGETR